MELKQCRKGLDSIREKCGCELMVSLGARRNQNATAIEHVVVADQLPATNPDFIVLVAAGAVLASRGEEGWEKLRQIVADIERHPGSVTEIFNA